MILQLSCHSGTAIVLVIMYSDKKTTSAGTQGHMADRSPTVWRIVPVLAVLPKMINLVLKSDHVHDFQTVQTGVAFARLEGGEQKKTLWLERMAHLMVENDLAAATWNPSTCSKGAEVMPAVSTGDGRPTGAEKTLGEEDQWQRRLNSIHASSQEPRGGGAAGVGGGMGHAWDGAIRVVDSAEASSRPCDEPLLILGKDKCSHAVPRPPCHQPPPPPCDEPLLSARKTMLSSPCLPRAAGPGSGKTNAFAHRVAHLLSIGVPPSNILGFTFTRSAAVEMRSNGPKITSMPFIAIPLSFSRSHSHFLSPSPFEMRSSEPQKQSIPCRVHRSPSACMMPII